jgi:hypothetical protein
VSLTPAELAAARSFRGQQRAALAALEADITADVHVRCVRHDCAKQGGKSVFLELREHYVWSPEYWVCYCGAVEPFAEYVFPHKDCQGGKLDVPAKRFGWIFTEGRCSACGMTARSSAGRLVDPETRPPSDRAVIG